MNSSQVAAREATSPARLSWMLIFFVASGVSGLIYQSIWTQYLSLILGSAAYAQSLVLAIFMGGMAIGAWLAARWVHRLRDLLWTYGAIEAGIGVFGIAFHGLYLIVSAWLYDTWLPALGSPMAISLARWTVAAALILPQTIALGMTFPIMSAGLMRWMPARAGEVLGGLYFFNSIGAAGGALLATFFLVPTWGLPGAMGFAGLINLAIFAGVLRARVPGREAAPAGVLAPAPAGQDTDGRVSTRSLHRLLLIAAALTGLSSFMYEIGWVRMLSLALGSSLHAFELMLAAFIGGLALGGWQVRRHLDDSRDPLRFVGIVQVLMGVAALATLPLYDHAFVWVSWLMRTLAPSASGYVLYNAATAVISMAIMLPAAFFAGMTLPAMTFTLLRRGVGESAVGQTYAANTAGAIVGVMLMMHLALPTLGLKWSMIVAAAIDLVLGLILLVVAARGGSRRPVWVGATLTVIALIAAIGGAQFDPRRMNSGVYRSGVAELAANDTIVYAADGKTASVALHGVPGKWLAITTNGKPDAGMNLDPKMPPRSDEPTMILLGLTGLAFHPQARDIANIGFGSGLTTHAFTTSSLPTSITTVEIEPRMIEAARGFGARVAGAFEDPRARIVIDDARAYFSGMAAHYDLIVSEPSNPWVSGVSKLFSTEFYAFVKQHLKPGGMLVQWVQGYEIADATLLSTLRALDGAFADYALYLSNDNDLVIVASPDGPLPEISERFLADPRAAELAALAGIRTARDLVERKLADKRVIGAVLAVDGGPTNSDFRPVLAHWAPRDRFMRERANVILTIYDSPLGIYSRLGLYPTNDDSAWRLPPISQPQVARRRIAEDMTAILLGDTPFTARGDTDSDQLWRGLAQRLRELGGQCYAGAPPKVGASLAIRAYQATAPFLSDARLRQLWVERPWQRCEGEAPEVVRVVDDTLAALLEARGGDLERAAWRVMREYADDIDPELVPYFAHAVLYAAALQGQTQAPEDLMRHARDHLDLSARGALELELTRAVLGLAPSSLAKK